MLIDTYLAHELRDHTVEAAALEVQWLARLADTFLACESHQPSSNNRRETELA